MSAPGASAGERDMRRRLDELKRLLLDMGALVEGQLADAIGGLQRVARHAATIAETVIFAAEPPSLRQRRLSDARSPATPLAPAPSG